MGKLEWKTHIAGSLFLIGLRKLTSVLTWTVANRQSIGEAIEEEESPRVNPAARDPKAYANHVWQHQMAKTYTWTHIERQPLRREKKMPWKCQAKGKHTQRSRDEKLEWGNLWYMTLCRDYNARWLFNRLESDGKVGHKSPTQRAKREIRMQAGKAIRVCPWWQQVNISICHAAIMWLRSPARQER